MVKKISIIVPTYNYGAYIYKTINSVLAQSYNNYELLVVDDGSKDNTRDVVLSYKDSRIHYFYQENQGANVARNRGIIEAKGAYFLFLDSDDLLEPDHLESYLQVAVKNPEANVYGPWAKGTFVKDEFVVCFAKGKCPGDDLLEHWIGNWWVASNCIFWPRGNLAKVGGWDQSLSANQDGDIAMRALIHGVPFVYAENAPVAKILMHEDEAKSISDTLNEKTILSRLVVLEKVEDMLLEIDSLHRNYRDALALKYYYHARETMQNYPDLSKICFKNFRRLYRFRKPPGSYMNWFFITLFGLRFKEWLSMKFGGKILWRI